MEFRRSTEWGSQYVADVGHRLLPAEVVEGRFASQHLESEHPYGPDIDLFCVGGPCCDLGASIIESPTARLSLGLTADGPSKIAYFTNSLHTLMCTWLITTFSGFKSL